MRASLWSCLVVGLVVAGCKPRDERAVEDADAAGRADTSAFSLATHFEQFDARLVRLGVKKSRAQLREHYAGFTRDTWAATEAKVMEDAARGVTSEAEPVGQFIAKLGDEELARRWAALSARAEAAALPVREQARIAKEQKFAGVVMVTGDLHDGLDCLARAVAPVTSAPLALEGAIPPDVRHVVAGALHVKLEVSTRTEKHQRQVEGRRTLAKVVVAAAQGDVKVAVADSVSATVSYAPKDGKARSWEVEVPFDETSFNDARARLDLAPKLAWPALCRALQAEISR